MNPIFRRILLAVILLVGFILFVYFAMIIKTPYAIIVPGVFLVAFWIDVMNAKRRRLKRRLARRERAQQRHLENPPVAFDP